MELVALVILACTRYQPFVYDNSLHLNKKKKQTLFLLRCEKIDRNLIKFMARKWSDGPECRNQSFRYRIESINVGEAINQSEQRGSAKVKRARLSFFSQSYRSTRCVPRTTGKPAGFTSCRFESQTKRLFAHRNSQTSFQSDLLHVLRSILGKSRKENMQFAERGLLDVYCSNFPK